MRPSHRYCPDAGGAGTEMGSDGNSSRGSGVMLTVGGSDGRFLLAVTDGDASGSGVVIGAAAGDCCTTV